jgi:hypothetical protein
VGGASSTFAGLIIEPLKPNSWWPEALGWALVPISIWLLIDAVLDAMAMGVF